MLTNFVEIRELNNFIEVNNHLEKGWLLLAFNLNENSFVYLIGREATNNNDENSFSKMILQVINQDGLTKDKYELKHEPVKSIFKPLKLGKTII